MANWTTKTPKFARMFHLIFDCLSVNRALSWSEHSKSSILSSLSHLGENYLKNYLSQTLGADLLDLKIFEDKASVSYTAEIWGIVLMSVEAGEVPPSSLPPPPPGKKLWEQISPCIAE